MTNQPSLGPGLVLLLGTLLACKGTQKPDTEDARPVVPAVAPTASTQPAAAQWKPGPDIAVLESIIAGTAKPTLVDNNGERYTISHYNVPGWSLALHAVRKDNPKAWKIQLETKQCDPTLLGPRVTLKGRDSANWYSIGGGPLEGMILKAFENPCIVHLATPEYAAGEQWKRPPSP